MHIILIFFGLLSFVVPILVVTLILKTIQNRRGVAKVGTITMVTPDDSMVKATPTTGVVVPANSSALNPSPSTFLQASAVFNVIISVFFMILIASQGSDSGDGSGTIALGMVGLVMMIFVLGFTPFYIGESKRLSGNNTILGRVLLSSATGMNIITAVVLLLVALF